MLGALLGEGKRRAVYAHPDQPDCVIKVLKDRVSAHDPNWLEYELWQNVHGTQFAHYFAPCLELTSDGRLIMVRASRCLQFKKRRRHLQILGAPIRDSKKSTNWGMISNRAVLIDYGHRSAYQVLERVKKWRCC